LILEKCVELRERKFCVLFFIVAFFAAMMLFAPALPDVFAHSGYQPPPADFEGKKASLFVKLDPPVVTDISQPIFISARFFDENTNQNLKEVTHRIFFKKVQSSLIAVPEFPV
jgi:hypothetical protein